MAALWRPPTRVVYHELARELHGFDVGDGVVVQQLRADDQLLRIGFKFGCGDGQACQEAQARMSCSAQPVTATRKQSKQRGNYATPPLTPRPRLVPEELGAGPEHLGQHVAHEALEPAPVARRDAVPLLGRAWSHDGSEVVGG